MRVENDTIDLEMRIREGKQATINKVIVKGNSRTNDHVVMRELRTRPGQLFSRSDIIRTTRELAQLRYFDPEKSFPTLFLTLLQELLILNTMLKKHPVIRLNFQEDGATEE